MRHAKRGAEVPEPAREDAYLADTADVFGMTRGLGTLGPFDSEAEATASGISRVERLSWPGGRQAEWLDWVGSMWTSGGLKVVTAFAGRRIHGLVVVRRIPRRVQGGKEAG